MKSAEMRLFCLRLSRFEVNIVLSVRQGEDVEDAHAVGDGADFCPF